MDFSTVVAAIVGTVGGGIILWILLFPLRHFLGQRAVKKKEQDPKLRTHFEDINKDVINHVSEIARSLAIRHERLVTNYPPISESYDFEKQESYKCFGLHFPEEVKTWKKLNNRTVDLNEKLVDFFQSHQYSHAASKQIVANNYIKDLQREFKDYAQRLTRKIESISKYGIGTEFKKLRECPICKKF